MNGTEEKVLLEDDLVIEKGFNDAIDGLRKSLGMDDTEKIEDLSKAKKVTPPFKKKDEGGEEPEKDEKGEEEPEEEEEDEGEEYRKSIEDTLAEEPEAAAAMDVEPFLLQLAKAIDESLCGVVDRVGKVEKLVKSIGVASLASAELQKSTRDIVKQISGQPIPSGSIKRLAKARFDSVDGNAREYDTQEVLMKSRDWIKTGKINLMEAGNIEGRVNKNLLGKVNDRLDQKVASLMKEGVA